MADLLIVDDDLDVAELLGDVLYNLGYATRIARDGVSGLRELATRRPDVVLLDVEMPGLDGPGMVHQMRIRDFGLDLIPIILVSGTSGLERVAARVGTPYFLAKPYSLPRLSALIEQALTERRAPIAITPS
jgi:two-component system, NtrC family, nitrogen regulation response regulator NtrX